MDELTRYILTSYPHLMTAREAAAHKSIVGESKAENCDSPKMSDFIRKRWVSTDPEVCALLGRGAEHFMDSVRDRILREHAGEVFLNHCPKCGALTMTPRARQCPKCFHSWHEEV